MSQGKHAVEFAARLHALKEGANRSYEALAKRVGVSSSSLHRYCTGQSTPDDYATVARFAAACRASKDEAEQLLRSWVLATTASDHGSDLEKPALVVPRAGTEPSRGTLVVQGRPATPVWDHGRRAVIVSGVLALLAIIGGLRSAGPGEQVQRQEQRSGLLLSSSCAGVLVKGAYGPCVQDLQSRLQEAGLKLPVDAAFGPYTKMRVEAFQIFAGLPSTGMVDEETKVTLYDAKVKVNTWSRDLVQRRLMEVFPEDPKGAIELARCLSALDPLWISGHPDQTRAWGLFQFRDRELVELDISPATALDPEWNIQTARSKWGATKDFSRWDCQPQFGEIPPG